MRKKRSSQASWKNMLPGNSFPQICVVSVNESVEKQDLTQEHLRSAALSNPHVYWLVKSYRFKSPAWFNLHRGSSNAASPLLMAGCMAGCWEGRIEMQVDRFFAMSRATRKKEEFPGLMEKHAAWELLSPDLRCFCKQVCGKTGFIARARKGCGFK
jgi:hypothetical protein